MTQKQVKSQLGKRFPKYRVHKASGRAFIWWNKKRNYLGPADSPESIEAYNQFVAEIIRTKGLFTPEPATVGAAASSTITVGALMAACGWAGPRPRKWNRLSRSTTSMSNC